MSLLAGVLATLVLCLAPGLASAQAGETVGDDTCLGCHGGPANEAYQRTVHAKALARESAVNARVGHGCEACHGPGAVHARSGGRDADPAWLAFDGTEPAEITRQNESCLGCHQGGSQRLWHGSPHESRDGSCLSCHTVMRRVSERALLSRSTESAVCRQCHPLAAAQAMRTSHMPMRQAVTSASGESFMSCASCHEPHGTIADSLIRAHTVNDSCYGCHADKRGPLLWEHAPVSESCLNCHVPHGSLQPNMLRMAGPRLCQSCHVATLHPSEARLGESRFVLGANCMHCHSQVHGSNHPSGMFFTR